MASEQHPPSVVVNRDDAEQLEIEKKNKFIMDWILGLNASWAIRASSATSTTEDEEDEEDEINDNEDYDENDEEDYENDEEDEEEDAEDANEEQPEDEESENNDENGLTHHIISVNMKDNDFLTYTFFTELRKALAQNHSSWPGLVSKFASFSRDFRYLKCAIEMVLEKNETWRPYNVQELYDKVFHKLKQRELIPTFDLQVVLFTLLSVFEKSTTASYENDNNLYHYIYPMIIELYEYLLER
ncbi:hypothetical protein C9374_012152 [Naegleria lovaniensis]|uniref:Uncharacterized protein n=1 Tax=Naegleria lovaniensis TaxID=51637 RepID=A0AA88KCM9_NAELO|nr:uncharacterized protein C9374_012152 [Naegleria lovaniensis]KAG2373413.1 hypothetical protein C9374_012152 [Naegleria lovaniensis]